MTNALSFDVEEYFQVTAFAHTVKPSEWQNLQSRFERGVDLALELLEQHGGKATFFTLGWVAERYPEVLRRVAEAGHEIACHSNLHRQVFRLTPDEFREDSRLAKNILEQVTGMKVEGYRAPSFSIRADSMWAFDVLAELGFRYDSSIFPVRHPNYGIAGAQRTPFLINTQCGPIVEFPMPTLSVGWRRAPFGGGAYLRLLPYWYTRWAMREYNRETGHGFCVYAHPWELDPEQPRLKSSITSRLRHYIGLGTVERKLRCLLRDFEFTTLASLMPAVLAAAAHTASAAGSGK